MFVADRAVADASRRPSARDEPDVVLSTALRRRWVLIVAATALVSILACVISYSRPATYTSIVRVLLRPLQANPLSASATNSGKSVAAAMTSEAALVSSSGVLGIVNRRLREHLVPGTTAIRVEVVTNSETLVINYRASGAEQARTHAQAVAQAYLQYRARETSRAVRAQLRVVQKMWYAARAALGTAAARVSKPNPPPDARSRVDLYASQVASLEEDIGDLNATSRNPGAVASDASLPSAPDGTPRWLWVLAAGLVAVAAASAIAIWRGRNDRVLRADSYSAIRGRPVFSVLPTALPPGDVASLDLSSTRWGRYLQIRAAVLAGTPAGGAVIVVAGIDDEVSPAGVAIDLAESLTVAGLEATVIDTTATSAARISGLKADGPVTDPADQVAGRRFRTLLQAARPENDYVVVAAPRAATTEGLSVALAGDVLVLTIVDGITRRRAAHAVVDRVTRLGIEVVCLIGTSGAEK